MLKYFSPGEFSGYKNMDNDFLVRLDKFREFVGRPIIIHSDYREGDGSSQHHLGLAVDIHIKGLDVLDQYLLAEKFDFSGIGVYPSWNRPGLHIDMRKGARARWLAYNSGNGQQYIGLNSENIMRYVIPLIKRG